MALRFLDSFDHYLAADVNLKWTTASATRVTGLHGSAMRGSFLKGMNFPGNRVIQELFLNRFTTFGSVVFSLRDTNNNAQINCGFNVNGAIEVTRYGGPILFQSAPDLIRTGTWYHFGWNCLVHPTAGAVELRLNGAVVGTLTNIPTVCQLYVNNPNIAFWSGTVGNFIVGDSAGTCNFDDLVVMDDVDDGLNDDRLTGGGGFDKFLGPVEIVCKYANGPGDLAEWTPTPVGQNWQNVDEVTPDADATFNSADPTAVGKSDLFVMENLLADEDVVAVQSLILGRKTQEGVAAVAKLVKDSGVVTAGTTIHQPSTYSYMHAPEPTRPGGGPWTAAAWDAIQDGYRRIL